MKYSYYYGVTKTGVSRLSLALIALAFALTAAVSMFLPVSAGHNGAVVGHETVACGETTFTAEIDDPDGTHKVANMRLVVDDGTTTHVSDPIPTDGTTVEVSVGPFDADTTIQWRVFGGGERQYDSPLWTGFGDQTFAADINAYGAANGFGWTVAGPDDENPFTTWHQLEVEGCPAEPLTKDDCKQGGYAALGFRNQGQCIRYVNTGQDSREL